MEFISNNLTAIILAVVALFAGIVITIKVRKNSNNNNSNMTTQKGNKVGGDQAGRDINKS